MTLPVIIERYRQPKYTGENRCMRCTTVNFAIAMVLGTIVFGGSVMNGAPTWITIGAPLVIVTVAGVQIWLRGYLVPGTPTLTKRYFPAWLLRLFGKEPGPAGGVFTDSTATVDIEDALLEADALETVSDTEEYQLTADFQTQYREALEHLPMEHDEALTEAIAAEFDLSGPLSISETRSALQVRKEGQQVGKWESRPALLADVASCNVLSTRSEQWGDMNFNERRQVVGGLRLYVDSCPSCDGPTSFDTKTATSCCNEFEVATVSCDDCGARLFELPVQTVEDR